MRQISDWNYETLKYNNGVGGKNSSALRNIISKE